LVVALLLPVPLLAVLVVAAALVVAALGVAVLPVAALAVTVVATLAVAVVAATAPTTAPRTVVVVVVVVLFLFLTTATPGPPDADDAGDREHQAHDTHRGDHAGQLVEGQVVDQAGQPATAGVGRLVAAGLCRPGVGRRDERRVAQQLRVLGRAARLEADRHELGAVGGVGDRLAVGLVRQLRHARLALGDRVDDLAVRHVVLVRVGRGADDDLLAV